LRREKLIRQAEAYREILANSYFDPSLMPLLSLDAITTGVAEPRKRANEIRTHIMVDSKTVAQQLGHYLWDLDYNDLPPQVVRRVKDLVLDQLGCEVLGSTVPWNQLVYRFVKENKASSPATIVGYLNRDDSRLGEYPTRLPEFYDPTFKYLIDLGIPTVP
jgi:hypothetical protein